jgi:hypothetical protein
MNNRECGPDRFSLLPFSLHFVSVTNNGPFLIPPQGSATFDLTIPAGTVRTGRGDHGGVHRVWPAPPAPQPEHERTVVDRVR